MARDELHAPHLIDFEFCQALRGLLRRGVIDLDDADTARAAFSELGIERYPFNGLEPRVWELRDNLTAYDASYVALAEVLDCRFVTGDLRLARAAADHVKIESVS